MSEIISIKSIKELKTIVEKKVKNKEKALFLSDIDLTLVIPTQKAVRYPAIKKNFMSYYWILRKHPDVTKTMITLLTPPKLIEKETPDVINNLGMKTILFTACVSGKAGPIASVKTVKYELVKKMGFDFSHTFSKDLSDPVFYKGILFSESESKKGEVAIRFLNAMKLNNLETIMMLDDRDSNLKDVEKALKKHFPHITFIGVEYGGAYDLYEPITAEEFKKAWSHAAKLAEE